MGAAHDRAASIFDAVVDLADPADRAGYLDAACGSNPQLRAEVEQLLAHDDVAGSFLDRPAVLGLVAAMAESITERPGTVIGSYKLLEQIGEGGFGVVFMAEQTQPVRRQVALKVLKPGMDSKQVIARFEAERQALALMDHPNIAKVLDGGQTGSGRPYFVMELVKGVPITEFCDQSQFTARERLELFVDVCQAVQHAHQKGIIHRDIKPSNVLVTLHDGTPRVKVIDFGIAKALGERLTDKTLFTGFAQMIGTPLYMAPEQAALSDGDVDTRSDIYSLSVLLYELLTGTTPFDRERFKEAGYDEMCRILREEEPPKPSTRISTLGQAAATVSVQRKSDPKRLSQLMRGELDWIVMKGLEKDRNRRYETASALASDVQRYLHDEPVQAGPPSAAYRFRKFARRHRQGLATAALVSGLLLAVAVTLGWQARDQAARRLVVEKASGQALDEARRWHQEGNLPEALNAARRAESVLLTDLASDGLRQRVRARLADLELLDRLENVRLEMTAVQDGHFDNARADTLYGQAFRTWGLELEGLTPEQVGERLRETASAVELAAVLDNWALVRRLARGLDDPSWQELLRAARAADPDAWRDCVRQALAQRDGKLLADVVNPDDIGRLLPPTLSAIADILTSSGGSKRAEALLRAAQRQHPNDFWTNNNLAFYLRRSRPRQLEDEIRYFTAAVALRPQSPGARDNLGSALRDAGRPSEAAAEFREAVRLKPDYPEAHYNLGVALADQGRVRAAVAEFRETIRIKKDFISAHTNLGNVLRDNGQLEEAVAEFREALRLNPNRADSHYNLGTALQRQGQLDEAVAEYGKAVRLRIDFAQAHCNLGLVLRDQGRFAEALAALTRGHNIGSRMPGWPYPSAKWIEQCERFVALDPKLPAVLSGREQPADTSERIGLADLCQLPCKKRYAAAVKLYGEAFAAEPSLVGDVPSTPRYNAACCAALAGCAQGEVASQLDENEHARLRRQALEWLRTDLAACQKIPERGPPNTGQIQLRMRQWLYDPNLAGVREPHALAKLPEAERSGWQNLWTGVNELFVRAGGESLAPEQ